MTLTRTSDGFEAELRIAGMGRFGGAAFLAVWLVFWAGGEAFALWMIVEGARSLLTGQPPTGADETLSVDGSLVGGLFLLFWLTFWTFGGLMAMQEMMRLLAGRELIRVRPASLDVEVRNGVFRSRSHVNVGEMRRFYRRRSNPALCVETTGGSVVVARLGTLDDWTELERELQQAYRLAEPAVEEGALASGWIEVATPEGERALTKDPKPRQRLAQVVWIVGLTISLLALYLTDRSFVHPHLWGAAILLSVVAIAVVWGAVWLAFGRNEWVLRSGRVSLRRRFGSGATERFDGVALSLEEDNSGDNGPSYDLVVLAPTDHQGGQQKRRKTLHRDPEDPAEPRKMGLWLSRRCRIPFEDLIPQRSRA